MIELKVSVRDYQNSSKEEKSRIFKELANHILVAHPEYYVQSQNIEMIDLCLDIMNATKDAHTLTKKEERKIKKLERKNFYFKS